MVRLIYLKVNKPSLKHAYFLAEAFKKTTEIFKNLDILINNAGIANDHTFDREIDVNVVSKNYLFGCYQYRSEIHT
jgi:NAD(P)-dependent dehydrogenase (short-subunit alcohol dehydrogenase family)